MNLRKRILIFSTKYLKLEDYSNMESKQEIRKRIVLKRSTLSDKERQKKSDIICDKVINNALFLKAEIILCYADFNGEVATRGIIEKAFELGKRVAVPKVNGEDMEFYYIHSFEELEVGTFGILEPADIETNCVKVVTDNIKNGNMSEDNKKVLVIMPCVAFDDKCNRIGYGKGYYDRYLSEHRAFRRIALAFDIQCVPSVPHDERDIRPEFVMTEVKIYSKEDTPHL
jgi:5-formyltetrahydrofolate cyclo-ligase